MHRRSIFTLSAIAALGLAMLPGSAVAQPKSLKGTSNNDDFGVGLIAGASQR
jgi:hypothetical protein